MDTGSFAAEQSGLQDSCTRFLLQRHMQVWDFRLCYWCTLLLATHSLYLEFAGLGQPATEASFNRALFSLHKHNSASQL